ncbi:MAG: hypothetical protein OXE53_00810 [Deltaproteobacteria bacterium]|nr:hypothetical protein [Deltaproteobacteria bacterium]
MPTPRPADLTDKFNIKAGDDAVAARRGFAAFEDNTLIDPLLEGHMLSYDGTTEGVTGIRQDLGLPVTGTDFSDASGLTAALSMIDHTYFDRNGGYGDGAGFRFGEDGGPAYTNWVDGVLFATYYDFDESVAPFVLGVPSESNPGREGTEDTAVWNGKVVGRKPDPIGHLEGKAKLTYDFGDASLDVLFNQLLYWGRGGTAAVSDKSWADLSVSNGVFGDCSGSGDCIRGRFFNDHQGTAAESVGGVFRYGELRGAFGAGRE